MTVSSSFSVSLCSKGPSTGITVRLSGNSALKSAAVLTPRSCDSGIRTLQPSGDYYSCGAFGDDNLYNIDFEKEMSGKKIFPLKYQQELQSLKQSCFTCPMFEICNGCKKTIKDLKDYNMVEDHCFRMKKIAPDIIEANGLTGILEPTPYVKEY